MRHEVVLVAVELGGIDFIEWTVVGHEVNGEMSCESFESQSNGKARSIEL